MTGEAGIHWKLTGQTAVVTGSSSGIGRAIALELARSGAHVMVHGGKNEAGAQAVVSEIRALGSHGDVVMTDLSLVEGQDELVRRSWDWRGGVDIWVNNAGVDVLTGEGARESFEQKLQRLWQVDVVAAMRLSRSVGNQMKTRGTGVLLNIGWDQAEQGMAGDSGELFSAVKGAVMAFTKSLAKSLAPQVRVNCLAPGWIRTAWGNQASEYWQHRATSESLLERWGTPEEIAQTACFLASPAASFITGQIIPVNGGFRASRSPQK